MAGALARLFAIVCLLATAGCAGFGEHTGGMTPEELFSPLKPGSERTIRRPSKAHSATIEEAAALFACREEGRLAECPDLPDSWNKAIDRLSGMPSLERLRTVNRAVNDLRYAADRDLHDTVEKWESGAAFLRRGAGDCEEFALAKMLLLQASGTDPDDMRLTVVYDARRSLYHAVLAVRTPAGVKILDLTRDYLTEPAENIFYRAYYSLGQGGYRAHL